MIFSPSFFLLGDGGEDYAVWRVYAAMYSIFLLGLWVREVGVIYLLVRCCLYKFVSNVLANRLKEI